MHRHVGFKRIHGMISRLLCSGMWGLSEFTAMSEIGKSSFVHRHVGFKGLHGLEGLLLCTVMWVLSDFVALQFRCCARACWFEANSWSGISTFVHRYAGFKRL